MNKQPHENWRHLTKWRRYFFDCTVPSRPVPSRPVPSRPVPSRTVPYRTVPYRTVPHRTAPHRTAPHRTAVPYRTAPCYVSLSCGINRGIPKKAVPWSKYWANQWDVKQPRRSSQTCCFDAGPASQTLGQHQNNTGVMPCVRWGSPVNPVQPIPNVVSTLCQGRRCWTSAESTLNFSACIIGSVSGSQGAYTDVRKVYTTNPVWSASDPVPRPQKMTPV